MSSRTVDPKEYNHRAELLRRFLPKLPAKRRRHYIDNFDLLKNYLEIKAFLGRVPREIEMGQQGRYARNNYRNHFGSYENFLRIIEEIPPRTYQRRDRSKPPPRKEPQPSHIELIQEFRRLKDELQRVPTMADIDEHSKYKSDIFRKAFVDFDKLAGV